jgi:hypothetical protein
MKTWIFILALLPFAAIAQNACDDLNFVSIQYSPFTDSVIVVEVENNSSELFDYPGFVLLNANGDTVAKELVNYFGIGSQSLHQLEVRQGVHDPQSDLIGQLKLFTGFYTEEACVWNIDQNLCATEPCDSLVIGFQNWGGALVIGDFAWSLTDADQNTVASGELTMIANEQYWFQGLCVEPGTYSYTLEALDEPSGGGPTLTAGASSWFGSPQLSQSLDWENATTLTIPFFDFCMSESPNGLSDEKELRVELLAQNGNWLVVATEPIALVELFSLDGKLLVSSSPMSSKALIPATDNDQLLLVRVSTEAGTNTLKLPFVRP